VRGAGRRIQGRDTGVAAGRVSRRLRDAEIQGSGGGGRHPQSSHKSLGTPFLRNSLLLQGECINPHPLPLLPRGNQHVAFARLTRRPASSAGPAQKPASAALDASLADGLSSSAAAPSALRPTRMPAGPATPAAATPATPVASPPRDSSSARRAASATAAAASPPPRPSGRPMPVRTVSSWETSRPSGPKRPARTRSRSTSRPKAKGPSGAAGLALPHGGEPPAPADAWKSRRRLAGRCGGGVGGRPCGDRGG
jgi:hypothetical protein